MNAERVRLEEARAKKAPWRKWGPAVAEEIGRRLSAIFLRDQRGGRPVHGAARKFQDDPHWRDYPLFYEYFHGDTGAGIGASHQTGLSGVVSRIMQVFATGTAQSALEHDKDQWVGPTSRPGTKK